MEFVQVRKVNNKMRDKKFLIKGAFTEIGIKVNLDSDIIHLNGKELKSLKVIQEVNLLNKLKNIITSCSAEYAIKTIIDFLPVQ